MLMRGRSAPRPSGGPAKVGCGSWQGRADGRRTRLRNRVCSSLRDHENLFCGACGMTSREGEMAMVDNVLYDSDHGDKARQVQAQH